MVIPRQIKKIHTLKKMLGIDEDLYKEMLSDFGVNSSKNLSFDAANIFIEQLESVAISKNLWKKNPLKYEDLVRDSEMATPAQLRLIEVLWGQTICSDTPKSRKKALRTFLQKKFKNDDVMFLTRKKASSVINGIKEMKKNIDKRAEALNK